MVKGKRGRVGDATMPLSAAHNPIPPPLQGYTSRINNVTSNPLTASAALASLVGTSAA